MFAMRNVQRPQTVVDVDGRIGKTLAREAGQPLSSTIFCTHSPNEVSWAKIELLLKNKASRGKNLPTPT